MGIVYRGAHLGTGDEVAIKTVRAADESLLIGIRRELHALLRLRHPGVVSVVDSGVVDGLPWYAMPLLRGRTWRARLQDIWTTGSRAPTPPHSPASSTLTGAMDLLASTHSMAAPPTELPAYTDTGVFGGPGLPDAPANVAPAPSPRVAGAGELRRELGILRRLCESLAYLHGEGIVHRDLKPENVFLTDERPVLMDFGLVTRFAVGREIVENRELDGGTLSYMAPEQILGEPVDARADLYAIGCMLYEALTGRPPFRGERPQVVQAHLSQTPHPPSALAENVPEGLDQLALALLAKDRRDRLGHAADVAAILARYADESPPETTPARPYLYRPELLGRDEAIGLLDQALGAGKRGDGSLVFVGGESGVGKSRFAIAVASRAKRRGFGVISGECLPPGAGGGPLHPLRPLLQAVADRCTSGGPAETDALLGSKGWLLAAYEPALSKVPGLARHPQPPVLQGDAARPRLLAALRETIAAMARVGPTLLVLDDLQWADELTVALLASTRPDDLGGAVLLGTYRSEEIDGPLRERVTRADATHLELGRLDERTVGDIARDMLAMARAPDAFVRFLAGRSQGNPFFVAEYLRLAVTMGLLDRDEAGRWRIAGADDAEGYAALPLPASVHDLVMRRVELLDPAALALASYGAVLGREFDGALLADVATLDELVRRQILEAEGARFRFVHDKLREILLERLAPAELAGNHRRAAEAIQGRGAGDAEAAALAEHWAAAGEPVRAWPWTVRAADVALDTAAFSDAVAWFRRALAADDQHRFVADPAERARLERRLGAACYGAGRVGDAHDALRGALARVGQPLPSSTAGWAGSALAQLAGQLFLQFLAPAPLVTAGEARRRALAEAAEAARTLVYIFVLRNEPLATVGVTLRAANLALRAGREHVRATDHATIGTIAGFAGLKGLAARYFALADAHEAGAQDRITATLAQSTFHLGMGRWDELFALAEAGLALSKDSADRHYPDVFGQIRCTGLQLSGRLREAVDEGRRIVADTRSPMPGVWLRIIVADSLVLLGRPDEAWPLLTEARRTLDGTADLASLANCLAVEAGLRLASGDLDGALGAAREAQDVASRGSDQGFGGFPVHEHVPGVFLAGCAAGANAEALERAGLACKAASSYAARFPIGRPIALREAARLDALTGRRSRGLEPALAAARDLGMRFEEARTLEAMGAKTEAAALLRELGVEGVS
jgi:serine/threonine protein kinase